jgi:hypothetical protein
MRVAQDDRPSVAGPALEPEVSGSLEAGPACIKHKGYPTGFAPARRLTRKTREFVL